MASLVGAVSTNWKLPEELTALSIEKSWPEVLKEWRLSYVEFLGAGQEAQTCLCHHHPIREVCHIIDIENRKTAIVGNCCVTRFEEKEPYFVGVHKILDAFRRIQQDASASANKELIKYAFTHDIINRHSYDFYRGIWRKQKLSQKQWNWKIQLNKMIVEKINASRNPDPVAEQVQSVAKRILQQHLENLRTNPTGMADRCLVDFAYEKGCILEKDRGFYVSLFERHVRVPSVRQQNWINDINRKILRNPL